MSGVYWASAQDANVLRQRAAAAMSVVTWFYGERLGDTQLCFAADVDDVAAWRHGVLFAESVELAWWRTADAFEIRCIVDDTSQQSASLIDGWPHHNTLTSAGHAWPQSATRLYGENDGTTADWAEARIPRRLNYPIRETPLPPRVSVTTRQLWWPSKGVYITRLCRVHGAEVPHGDQTI